jgi:hypothetical protein
MGIGSIARRGSAKIGEQKKELLADALSGITKEPSCGQGRLMDRFRHLTRKSPSNSLAFSRGNGMTGRIFTDEEREAAEHKRREGRQRLADEASATVDQLLAVVAGAVPAWALAHAEKARKGRLLSLVVLKCGDCSGWQKTEIAGCAVTSCPLHPLQPYRA